MKLTARSIKTLPAVVKPTYLYDAELRGFGLRRTPPNSKSSDGSASWIVEYRRKPGGRGMPKERIIIGPLSLLEPGEARSRAKDILALVQSGGDPKAPQREARLARTVAQLVGDVRKPSECIVEIVSKDPSAAELATKLRKTLRPPEILAGLNERGYRTEHATGYQANGSINRKPRTRELAASYWRIHLLPEIGTKKLRDLTHADVVRLHGKIGEKHRATANRCVSMLRHFGNWCSKMGHAPAGFVNPARGVEFFKESGSERFLTPAELEALGDALNRAETVGIPWPEPVGAPSKHRARREEVRRSWITPSAAAAIRLLVLTGARLREILNLRWAEVDFERGLLLLPDSKTGKKSIVLGASALEILEILRATSNGEYVIAGNNPDRPRSDLNRPWALVLRAAGLSGIRIHHLRHTYASVGASGGLGLPMIGRLLGHADTRTTQRYAHLANDASRRAADLIGADIASAMRGAGSRAPGALANG